MQVMVLVMVIDMVMDMVIFHTYPETEKNGIKYRTKIWLSRGSIPIQ